jgi:putative oxidoreductase
MSRPALVDAGLLLLRLAVGLALVAHGRHTVTRWFGGGGGSPVAAASRPEAGLPAEGASATGPMAGPVELLAGSLLVVGLLTPFGAAVVVGLAAVVCQRAYPRSGPAFAAEQRFLLCAALGALTLAFAGPGALSLDGALGLKPRGPVWGLVTLAFGLVGATAVLGGGDHLEDPLER